MAGVDRSTAGLDGSNERCASARGAADLLKLLGTARLYRLDHDAHSRADIEAYAGHSFTVAASATARTFAPSSLTDLVLPPQLGVVLFRRSGWGPDEWRAWATRCLESQIAFVAPSTYRGEPVGRLVFMHPSTPDSIVGELTATLAS